jgi:REP element-mobilizing transposase RayT
MGTYTQILYQVVFGSKNCTHFLDTENESILFNYVAGVIRNQKGIPYITGGHENHLHLIFSLHPTITLSGLIRYVKRASHEMMKENESFRFFPGWQVGYGGFSYALSSKNYLIDYVKGQKTHHKTISFRDEYITLIKEHGIDIDEKYLFD